MEATPEELRLAAMNYDCKFFTFFLNNWNVYLHRTPMQCADGSKFLVLDIFYCSFVSREFCYMILFPFINMFAPVPSDSKLLILVKTSAKVFLVVVKDVARVSTSFLISPENSH